MAFSRANSGRKREEPQYMVAETRDTQGVSTQVLGNKRSKQVLYAEGPRDWKDVLSLGNELSILFCFLILTVLGTLIRGSLRIVSIVDGWSKVERQERRQGIPEYEGLDEEHGTENCYVRILGDRVTDPGDSDFRKNSGALGRKKRPRGRHKEEIIEEDSPSLGMNERSDKKRHSRNWDTSSSRKSSGSKPLSVKTKSQPPHLAPESQSPSELTPQVLSSDSEPLLPVSVS